MKIIHQLSAEYGIVLPQVCPVIGVRINNYKGSYETPRDGTVKGHLVLLDDDRHGRRKSFLTLQFEPIENYEEQKSAYRPIKRSDNELRTDENVFCVRVHKSGRIWASVLSTELELDIPVILITSDFVEGYFDRNCQIKRGAYGSCDPAV